ncbi:uncharacterized protein LACBIDRAFT_333100 [Laccaria bicolor S238N-H82]|uniref:Predicted protein n=1 Tax=Laccaria bicolor (strain S238N-H82 / ATCC MYA-4686) TaxID=486041 RepID=B0DUV6_LACBS|nr:uncharacterized protein LACBIDRAFT_333100 [Laccaria bicolor S238N-H82]EDR01610.1 predicted protein [Laccaria bicolor S238N-H82]|eukprot:XP_001887686.1 predicted protein [Laccaria bicolor S238N-H82]
MTATTNNVDAIQEVSAISPCYAIPHPIVLQDRLVELTEMERNNSEMTDDSPFTSALTTPVDQDVPINVFQGIHKALARDMDGSAVDSYFDSKAVGKGAHIAQVSQQLEERRVVEVEVSFMLLSTAEPFYSHLLDSPRRSVGTGGDIGPGSDFGPAGDVSPRNDVILGEVVIIGCRRHNKRQAISFPAKPRTESYAEQCLEPNIDPKVTPSSVLTDDYEPRYPHFVFHAVAMSAIRPSKGIYRFAHFAECGMQYSMTFLASRVLFIYEFPNLGTVITGGLLALFFHAWQDFEVNRNVPLGHDDRQMIYILATSFWLTGDSVSIQKVDDQYYLSSATLKNRELMCLLRRIWTRSEMHTLFVLIYLVSSVYDCNSL